MMNMTLGTVPTPNMTRQPVATFHASSPKPLINRLQEIYNKNPRYDSQLIKRYESSPEAWQARSPPYKEAPKLPSPRSRSRI